MNVVSRLATGVPGLVTVGGREFVIPAQTPGDAARVHDRMRRLALAGCRSPLEYVAAQPPEAFPYPADRLEAIRAAVALGSGGGVEPTREAVVREYGSLAGVRWRLWYHARKTHPDLTQADADALVTDDTVYEVADALEAALGLQELDPKKA